MAIKYKLYPDGPLGMTNPGVQKTDDNGRIFSIPNDLGNVDYQEYLKWVDEGNTAEAAD